LIYQHARSERDRGIDDRMSALVEASKPAEPKTDRGDDDDGAAGVLAPVG
jgi:hypothetical protein